MKHDSDFPSDLETGKEGEELLKEIARAYLDGGESAVEVKNDRKVAEKGNVYIEKQSRGEFSGIDSSRSPWWAYVLDGPGYKREVIVIIKTERLREICNRSGFGNIRGGDSDTSTGYLIPVEKLVQCLDRPRLFPDS